MVHEEWLNEGDVIITEMSMKYFNDLIEYVKDKGLKRDFDKWRLSKKPNEKVA